MRPPDTATTHLAGPRTLGIPKIRLKVLKGPDKGTTVTLEQDEILIGGADGAHLRLTDPTVSRNHCVIRLTAKGPLLRDLGSTNGTRIEGVEVREGYVPAGATLALGHTQVRFEQLDESVQIPLADSERFGRLWGRSTAMRRLFAVAGRVAATDVTVLIQGETGTGKDALAEAIHEASTRAAGPFVVVDCGAVPPNLIESELFGHEKGAFTGADRARAGALRGGRRRHRLPRRDRRAAADAAAQAAARAGGARGAARRRRRSRARSTCASSPPPTATCARRSTAARFRAGPLLPPRRWCGCRCRRCASAPRTSRCSREHFRQLAKPGAAGGPAVRRGAGAASWRTRGRATCASCATPSNA